MQLTNIWFLLGTFLNFTDLGSCQKTWTFQPYNGVVPHVVDGYCRNRKSAMLEKSVMSAKKMRKILHNSGNHSAPFSAKLVGIVSMSVFKL